MPRVWLANKKRDFYSPSNLQMYMEAHRIFVAHRTGDIICGAQSKMKTCGTLFKNYYEFQEGDCRAIKHTWDSLLRVGRCVTALVSCLGSRPWLQRRDGKANISDHLPCTISATLRRYLWFEYQFTELWDIDRWLWVRRRTEGRDHGFIKENRVGKKVGWMKESEVLGLYSNLITSRIYELIREEE